MLEVTKETSNLKELDLDQNIQEFKLKDMVSQLVRMKVELVSDDQTLRILEQVSKGTVHSLLADQFLLMFKKKKQFQFTQKNLRSLLSHLLLKLMLFQLWTTKRNI